MSVRVGLAVWLVLLVVMTTGPVGYLRFRDIDPDSTFSPVVLIIAYAPALAAFAAAAIVGGRAEVVALLRRFRNWRVSPWAYVAVLAGPVVLMLIAHATDLRSARMDGGWPDLGGVGAAAGSFVAGSVGEEPGWRGWAHPLLRRRLSTAATGVVVGLVWALWHEWVLLAPGAAPSGADIALNSVRLVATAVIYGWLVEVTGSLPLIMVAHFGHNLAVALLAPITLTSQAVVAAGYVIVAVGLLLFGPRPPERLPVPHRPHRVVAVHCQTTSKPHWPHSTWKLVPRLAPIAPVTYGISQNDHTITAPPLELVIEPACRPGVIGVWG